MEFGLFLQAGIRVAEELTSECGMQFAQFVQVASDRLIEGAPSGVYNLCGAGKFLVSYCTSPSMS